MWPSAAGQLHQLAACGEVAGLEADAITHGLAFNGPVGRIAGRGLGAGYFDRPTGREGAGVMLHTIQVSEVDVVVND